MLLGICLDVSAEAHGLVRQLQMEFRDRYNIRYGLGQPPHITLKRPFQWEDSTVFENWLGPFAREQKPFPVVIENLGFFSEGVVYLKVEPTPPLVSLQQKVCEILEDKFGVVRDPLEKEGFVFHLTLAYADMTQEIFQNIKEDYKNYDCRMEFEAAALTLLRNDGKDWLSTRMYLFPAR